MKSSKSFTKDTNVEVSSA